MIVIFVFMYCGNVECVNRKLNILDVECKCQGKYILNVNVCNLN